jgi:hypothetical protein
MVLVSSSSRPSMPERRDGQTTLAKAERLAAVVHA